MEPDPGLLWMFTSVGTRNKHGGLRSYVYPTRWRDTVSNSWANRETQLVGGIRASDRGPLVLVTTRSHATGAGAMERCGTPSRETYKKGGCRPFLIQPAVGFFHLFVFGLLRRDLEDTAVSPLLSLFFVDEVVVPQFIQFSFGSDVV